MVIEALTLLVGTLGVLAHGVERWRRKSCFRITAHLCDEGGLSSWNRPGQHHLAIEALNIGERPAALALFGYSLGTGGSNCWNAQGPSPPVRLRPGESFRQVVALEANVVGDPDLLAAIWAEDSIGIRYELPRPQVLAMRDELAFSEYRGEMQQAGWVVT